MKKKDLHAELAKKRFRKPYALPYFVYYFVGRHTPFLGNYHPEFERIDDIGKCKGPAFIIWNHQSRRDHTFITSIAWPRKISIVCEYNEFFREHLAPIFKTVQILPKKVFCNDVVGIRAMRDIIKQGGIVAFAPEGTSSLCGDNQPIVPGTGRFLQAFKVPVYMVYLRGSYLTSNKADDTDRIGKVKVTSKLLFSPDDLSRLSSQEIDDIINEEFHHDDYKWNKIERIPYKAKSGIAKGLSGICYKCPKCGAEFEMESKDDYIRCKKCGNGAHLNEYYDLIPFDENCVIPETPSDWAHNERQDLINEIRLDKNYSFSFKCKIGDLPRDHYVKKTDTSELCGEGTYTIDHKGVHFVGTKHGENWEFHIDYKGIQTYPMAVDVSRFSLYVNEEFYDFIPEIPCVTKVIMLTEEMHRLHVNKFKNFPWFDYMYEGKELGIDEKK